MSAERENDPLTGIDWQNAAAILAMPPCPYQLLVLVPANTGLDGDRLVQLDIASMKLMSAMTNAAGTKAVVTARPHSSAGTPTPGGAPRVMLPPRRGRRSSANPEARFSLAVRMATADPAHPEARGAISPERDEHGHRREAETERPGVHRVHPAVITFHVSAEQVPALAGRDPEQARGAATSR